MNDSNILTKLVSGLNRVKSRPGSPALLVVLLIALAGSSTALFSQAAPRTSTTTSGPMTLTEYNFSKRWTDKNCFSVDDDMTWMVTGSLKPGESYTFTPQHATCAGEVPYISSKLTWGTSELQLTSKVKLTEDSALKSPSFSSSPIATGLTARNVGNEANTCMFMGPQDYTFEVTVTNVGSATSDNVKLTGVQRNGWPFYYYHECYRSDVDHDGWNDSLEQITYNLTSSASSSGNLALWEAALGTDYLFPQATSATPDDEIDKYMPDVNDDGVVDQKDVSRAETFLGQGNQYGIDAISASGDANDPAFTANLAASYRRYDLNGDGRVTPHDVAMIKVLIGQPIPMAQDVLSPRIFVKPSLGTTVAAGSDLTVPVFASDNQFLTKVEFYLNGKLTTNQCYLPRASGIGTTCRWIVPRKRNVQYSIQVKAYDQSNNATLSDPVVVTAT